MTEENLFPIEETGGHTMRVFLSFVVLLGKSKVVDLLYSYNKILNCLFDFDL